jgi:hypothetical protein
MHPSNFMDTQQTKRGVAKGADGVDELLSVTSMIYIIHIDAYDKN